MKNFDKWLQENELVRGGVLSNPVLNARKDDEIVQQKGMVKYNKRPADHDQWKCNKCGEWNNSNRGDKCSACRRGNGGERVETRNGSMLLKSTIRSLDNAIQELRPHHLLLSVVNSLEAQKHNLIKQLEDVARKFK
jgi:hypothetical protein